MTDRLLLCEEWFCAWVKPTILDGVEVVRGEDVKVDGSI